VTTILIQGLPHSNRVSFRRCFGCRWARQAAAVQRVTGYQRPSHHTVTYRPRRWTFVDWTCKKIRTKQQILLLMSMNVVVTVQRNRPTFLCQQNTISFNNNDDIHCVISCGSQEICQPTQLKLPAGLAQIPAYFRLIFGLFCRRPLNPQKCKWRKGILV